MAIRWKSGGVFVLCASAMLITIPTHAATGPISVIIDGQTLSWTSAASCTSQLTCFNIAGNYNGLRVDPYFVGSGQSAYARVNTPSADSSSDSLQITNTRISNTTGSDKTFTIEIQQQDTAPPANNPSQWYNTSINGVFGLVNGNFIDAHPYVKVGSTGAWQNGWDATHPVRRLFLAVAP